VPRYRRGVNRTVRPGRGAALVGWFVLVVVLGTACGGEDEAGYDEASRDAFLAACVEDDGNADLAEVCECTYEQLVRTVPFAEFAEFDRAVGAGDPLPPAVLAVIDDCISTVSRDRS